EFRSPLIVEREVKNVGVVVYGSDDGLCGAYNLNIFKHLLAEMGELRRKYGANVGITLFPVGKKIARACDKIASQPHIEVVYVEGVDSKMDGDVVRAFTERLRSDFSSGKLDMVEVVYMQFHSISRQRLTIDRLYPVRAEMLLERDATKENENQLYIFEPDANEIFNAVLPMFVQSMMQEITIENRASEQAARVMAMQAANDNARKLEESLQLEFNKLRQQSITTELLDILGGQVER
ncbi:MAG: F0F1 ATP synthase subunit gamma, partial [Muribaculaceae bacterium]|nr:F0F1 ATP synthase subunit gamma [Muribaculaceae bacterium]